MTWVAVAIGGSAVLGYVGSQQAADKQSGAAGQASQVQQNMFNQTQGNLAPWMNSGQSSLAELDRLLGIGTNGAAGFDPQAYLAANPDVAQKGMDPYQHYLQYGKAEGRQFTPVQTGGTGQATGSLTKPFSLADFQASPAYEFNLGEGMKAIGKSAAARGKYYAPATLQDIGKYSQGVASNEFQNAFNNYNTDQNNVFNRLFGVSNSGQNAANQTGTFGANTANQVGQNTMGAGNAAASGIVGGTNAITGGAGDAYNNYLIGQVLAKKQTPTYGGGSTGGTFGGS